MKEFILELKMRNETLFYFGLISLFLAIIFLASSQISSAQVQSVSTWNKPFKFAASIGIYVWTMAWYCYYLPAFNIRYFNIATIVFLGFEIIYIAIQAGRGQLSHFNLSTPVYSFLYTCMALAASGVAVYSAYTGYLFFKNSFPELPDYYVWAIRFGILIFVIFSFEGFAMGSRLNHSVGALNDNSNLIIVGWSKTAGDLRIAHFFGMHALQILPLLAYFVIRNTKGVLALSALYFLLAALLLIQTVKGQPLLREKHLTQQKQS